MATRRSVSISSCDTPEASRDFGLDAAMCMAMSLPSCFVAGHIDQHADLDRRARSWRACPGLRCARSGAGSCSRRSCRPVRCGCLPPSVPLVGQRGQRGDIGRILAQPPSRPASLASARKSSFLATKSVSQLTSIMAADLPSALMAIVHHAFSRHAAGALAGLVAEAARAGFPRPSACRRRLPFSAFLQSIIGASVLLAQILDHACGNFCHFELPIPVSNNSMRKEGHDAPPRIRSPGNDPGDVATRRVYSAATSPSSSTSTNSSPR